MTQSVAAPPTHNSYEHRTIVGTPEASPDKHKRKARPTSTHAARGDLVDEHSSDDDEDAEHVRRLEQEAKEQAARDKPHLTRLKVSRVFFKMYVCTCTFATDEYSLYSLLSRPACETSLTRSFSSLSRRSNC